MMAFATEVDCGFAVSAAVDCGRTDTWIKLVVVVN